jgi:hypothetical protein
VEQECKGIPLGGLCTNQFRLCDRGLFCPNKPPGHAKCEKQKALGEHCMMELNLIGLLQGKLTVNECVPGAHCLGNKCVSNDSVKAKLGKKLVFFVIDLENLRSLFSSFLVGENCTGRVMVGHFERMCETDLYCNPHSNSCVKWPQKLWASCKSDTDCDRGMSCNCKVGGTKVCEIPGEEGLALLDFMTSASKEVTDCIHKHDCFQGASAYPNNIFNAHSCAWKYCRKHMGEKKKFQ